MKINEVEQAIGITKKNIRFYEEAGLLAPSRGANGYRDYSQEDVTTLQQIKLLRRLDIPIEEIKRLQAGNLTLEDCLRRHLIVLERKSKNLETMEKFCERILTEQSELNHLPVEHLLDEMQNIEEGGMRFVDIRKQDKAKRKQTARKAAFAAILFMVLPIALILWAAYVDPEVPLPILLLLILLPAVGIIGTLLALKERLKEIEEGELDEASKY